MAFNMFWFVIMFGFSYGRISDPSCYWINTSTTNVCVSSFGFVKSISFINNQVTTTMNINIFNAYDRYSPKSVNVVQQGDSVVSTKTYVANGLPDLQSVEKIFAVNGSIRWDTQLSIKSGQSGLDVSLAIAPSSPGVLFWLSNSDRFGSLPSLEPSPYNKATFKYIYGVDLSLPMISFLLPGALGVSIASPDDNSGQMMFINDGSKILIKRLYNQIQSTPRTFTNWITAHGDGWRSGLKWITQQFPSYFEAPSFPDIDGSALNRAFRGGDWGDDIQKLNVKLNLDATLPYPWYGEYMPSQVTWSSCLSPKDDAKTKPFDDDDCDTNLNVGKINDWYNKAKDSGVQTLSFISLLDFGYNVYPNTKPTVCTQTSVSDNLACQSTKILRETLDDSALKDTTGAYTTGIQGAVILDPAFTSWSTSLVTKFQNMVNNLTTYGLVVGGSDPLYSINPKGSDGYTFYNGKPAGTLIYSYIQAAKNIKAKLTNKPIYLEPKTIMRLDTIQPFDGLVFRFQDPKRITSSVGRTGLLTLKKPLYVGLNLDNVPDPLPQEVFIQSLLYTGANPLILSGKNSNKFYAYMPLFRLFQGKQWILDEKAVVIHTPNPNTVANIFKTSSGVIVPVVFGKPNEDVQIDVNVADVTNCQANYPGPDTNHPPVKVVARSYGVSNHVNLHLRGCVVLVCN